MEQDLCKRCRYLPQLSSWGSIHGGCWHSLMFGFGPVEQKLKFPYTGNIFKILDRNQTGSKIFGDIMKTYLNCLHWSKSNISEKFSRCGCHQVERSTVKKRIFFSHHVTVSVFEDFIESELADTLHGVSNCSWGPSSSQGFDTTFSQSDLIKNF